MKMAWVWMLVCCLGLPACAEVAPKAVKITKVQHDTYPQKQESALAREIGPNETGKFKELREDFKPQPDGEYFTVIWKSLAREPLKNVTVTLQYRQANSPKLQSTTVQLAEVRRGTTISKFRVVGEEYTKGGAVTAWKTEVSGEGRTLDSFHSFLWKDPS